MIRTCLIAIVTAACSGSAATTPAPPSPSASVVETEGVETSGPGLAVAEIELISTSETEQWRDWAIAVTGGRPSLDVVTAPDPNSGSGTFTVTVFGQSATVEMTVTLPTGWELEMGSCFDFDNQVQHDALAGPRRLVVEVVPGVRYECDYQTHRAGASLVEPSQLLGSSFSAAELMQ